VCRYNDTVKKERLKATMEAKYAHNKLDTPVSEYEQVKRDEEEFLKDAPKITSIQEMDANKKVT
jgi:hypothetical protein